MPENMPSNNEFKFNPLKLTDEQIAKIAKLIHEHDLSIQASWKDVEDETDLVKKARPIAEQTGLSIDELVSYAFKKFLEERQRFVTNIIGPIYDGGPTRIDIRNKYYR